jgi:hypothetical protein
LAIVDRNLHLALVAAMPTAWGIALFCRRALRFRCKFDDDGLRTAHPKQFIPYTALEEVYAPDRHGSRFPITIIHERAYFELPAKLDVSSEDVYRFLARRAVGRPLDPKTPPILENYLRHQQKLSDPADLLVYRARGPWATKPRSCTGLLILLAVFLLGPVYLTVGLRSRAYEPWIAFGILGMFFGGVGVGGFAMRGWLERSRSRAWSGAGLVLAPGGFAMVHGKLKGELTWDQLKTVSLNKRRPFLASGEDARAGLLLTVPGANIVIQDIFHRPLRHLYDRLTDYRAGLR